MLSDIIEYLSERAAIMEHDGQLSKADAERGAILEAKAKFGDDAVDEAIRQNMNGSHRNVMAR